MSCNKCEKYRREEANYCGNCGEPVREQCKTCMNPLRDATDMLTPEGLHVLLDFDIDADDDTVLIYLEGHKIEVPKRYVKTDDRFICPHCDTLLDNPTQYSNTSVACGECDETFRTP